MNRMTAQDFKKFQKSTKTLSYEMAVSLQIFAAYLPKYETEYRFHPTRKWRFDFAWPDWKIAVECDGMAWQAGGGRHNTDADREKINTATSMGWSVLRFSGFQIRNNPMWCVDMVQTAFKSKGIDWRKA